MNDFFNDAFNSFTTSNIDTYYHLNQISPAQLSSTVKERFINDNLNLEFNFYDKNKINDIKTRDDYSLNNVEPHQNQTQVNYYPNVNNYYQYPKIDSSSLIQSDYNLINSSGFSESDSFSSFNSLEKIPKQNLNNENGFSSVNKERQIENIQVEIFDNKAQSFDNSTKSKTFFPWMKRSNGK